MQGYSPYWHLPLPVGGVGWPGATQWFHGHGQPLTSLGSEAGSGQEVKWHFLLPLALPSLLLCEAKTSQAGLLEQQKCSFS